MSAFSNSGFPSVLVGKAGGFAEFKNPGNWTWTCPDGVTQVLIEAIGGGGGGSMCDGVLNGTGGDGATQIFKTLSVIPGKVYTLTIGAGGAGSSSPYTGNNGGNTIFDNILLSRGGVSRAVANTSSILNQAQGGIGGVAGQSTANYSGGAAGYNSPPGAGGGGASMYGSGGAGGASTSSSGSNGQGYGAGGGAGWSVSAGRTGGAGGGGYMKIIYIG